MGKGLVMLHIDGVGHAFLLRALEQGRMPAVARLIEEEAYEPLEYRCGIPSTTPFCQAGILYGDNREIPSYRWWDKEAGLLVAFGHGSSFKKVAHRYFQGIRPLTQDGAVIGSCYPAGARETFGLAYRERNHSDSRSTLAVVAPFFASPLRVAAWLRHGAWAIGATTVAAITDRMAGRPPAPAYLVSDMLEEIFLHHVARYAVISAMERGFPTVYAGFYAYDETSHAFGPKDGYSFQMLRHVDETIGAIAAHRSGGRGTPAAYELVSAQRPRPGGDGALRTRRRPDARPADRGPPADLRGGRAQGGRPPPGGGPAGRPHRADLLGWPGPPLIHRPARPAVGDRSGRPGAGVDGGRRQP
jgi:hypothetical protein